MIRARRLATTTTAVALGVTALSACGGDGPLGGGLDVGICDAQAELDGLPEPRPGNREEVVRYADGALRIYSRVDLRLDAGEKLPVNAVRRELRVAETAMKRYRDEARGAKDGPGLTTAFLRLVDGAYNRASDRLADAVRKGCV